MSRQNDITQLVREASDGEPRAADALLPMVYDELRSLAERYLEREREGHTLRPTALVHEAYLKLVDQTQARWNDRVHFLAVAAQAMRRILVDHARARKRQRRGGGDVPVALHDVETLVGEGVPQLDLVALDAALSRLGETAPEKAQVVEMRAFAGLSTSEIAEVLGVTPRSVRRYWDYAQAWLYRELSGDH